VPDDRTWQERVADALLAGGVEAAAIVPDTRLGPIEERLRAAGCAVRTLTREEECVAYAAGRRAAGGLPAVLMQCSGLGNALNAVGSLLVPYGYGVPLVVAMRGTLGERNPAQLPVGRAARELLAALGVQSFSVRTADDVDEVVGGVVAMAAHGRATAAAILEPQLGGGRA
jgi:sulfopyruvate decarboxylase TPP-binding subunit